MTSSSEPDGQTFDEVGRVIAGKYRLERLLGEGGMGTVWRAFHLQLEVPVALKLLRAGDNAAELRERMRVEGRAVAKLVHPNIVRVFDIGEAESGEPFIVMELLHGESLGAILERGALAPISALQLLLPIAEALALAHSRGVVHRDLKPDNIVIATEGSVVQPKLLDFGIAKVRSTLATGAALTLTGTLLGSPEYMSPEQAHGRADIDERSDVWAFCVVLYEALAGRTPFEGETCQCILRSVAYDEPLPLLASAGVDPDLAAIVLRGLAKDREQRPSSMFELGRALASWLWAHGVYEDAAGCSLEAKWLARVADSAQSHALYDPEEQRWGYEHATLVSVVHPGPPPGSDEIVAIVPARRSWRWLPSALVVAGVAAAACIVWAVRHPGEFSTVPAAVLLAPAQRSEPQASPVLAARPDVVVAEPVLAVEPLPTVSIKPPTVKPVPGVGGRSAAPPVRSLPQALPRHENHAELLNPY